MTLFIVLCRAIKHLLEVLKPYTKENGGLLKVEHVTYVEKRGNLIIEYENVRAYNHSYQLATLDRHPITNDLADGD